MTSPDFLEQLRSLASGGLLPRWSTWWGGAAMEALVPDESRRAAVEAEVPLIPLAFYESPVELPARWCEGPNAYVLLSEAYRQDAERARGLGWPTVERPARHLDLVNDPDGLAADLVELAR